MPNLSRYVENAIDDIVTINAIEGDLQSLRDAIAPQVNAAVRDATAFYEADPKIVVKKALAFENGLIAAFDQGGNQIPEIQRYTLVEVLNLALALRARIAVNDDHAQVGALLAKCSYFESGRDGSLWWAWVRLPGKCQAFRSQGPTQLAAIKAAVEAAEKGVRE